MKQDGKWIWIVTGPNGSGKTTHYKALLPAEMRDLPCLNSDVLAHGLARLPAYEKKIDAYDEASARITDNVDKRIVEGTSFCMEITSPQRLSNKPAFYGHTIESLQAEGWKIGVLALGLESPAASLARVDERVQKGGHSVPAASRTWENCRRYTPELLSMADHVKLYDNSEKIPRLILEKEAKGAIPTAYERADNDYIKDMIRGASRKPGEKAWSAVSER